MITVKIGNVLESNAQTLVNTVNCVGVMGKGIALDFKRRFPEMFRDYERQCKRGEVQLGKPYLFKSLIPPWIVNFPTKDHWRSMSRIEDIGKGLRYLLEHYKEWGITSLAVPPLGCGSGQLEWNVVGPTLYRYLKRMDIPVELYAPFNTLHDELQSAFLDQGTSISIPGRRVQDSELMKPAWVAMVEILNRIEQERYHWPVGRIAFQKIAFVATHEGIPTDLTYEKGTFGPYSRDLNKLKSRLLNNGLIREEQLGRMFAVRVGPTFKDARRAYETHLVGWNEKIDRIVDLFVRMNTSQSEMVATVLYTASEVERGKETTPTEADVLEEVTKWKGKRGSEFGREKIASTIRNLAALGWLDVKPSTELPVPDEP